jgi:CRP/FNR family transcriptional regulator
VALKVLRVVGARLRRLVGIIEELSFTTVRHRLASFLLQQARKEVKRKNGSIEISLPASNQEPAAQIGTLLVRTIERNFSMRSDFCHEDGVEGRQFVCITLFLSNSPRHPVWQ